MQMRILFSLWILLVLGRMEAQTLQVNQNRLEKRIVDLSQFGKQANGTTERVAFSDADIAAREWVITSLGNMGCNVHIDHAGNIIATRPGNNRHAKPIAFGSHIDRVPNGGDYDGCLGAMAALEVIEVLNEDKIMTKHPFQVIVFANEEGGVMGSRALAGTLGKEALQVVNSTGYSMGEGIHRIGGDTTRLHEVKRDTGDLAAFVELHIEQGAILYNEKIPIGIVEGIVGLRWWDVTFTGYANHAGTTPMDQRQDALLAAAKFIVAVNGITNSFPGRQVGTVGRISAEPGAPNVIPGSVTVSLEIRDLSLTTIDKLFMAIKKEGEKIATDSNVGITFKRLDATADPALTDSMVQETIAESSKALGLSYKKMQSGAGHDAQDMSRIAPTGMIFVPSKDGISHSPDEFTSAKDMANGANVLLRTLLRLDQELD
ncbi:MAG: Zn-dependent hydrolase [Flavobacteriaceae bacterium]